MTAYCFVTIDDAGNHRHRGIGHGPYRSPRAALRAAATWIDQFAGIEYVEVAEVEHAYSMGFCDAGPAVFTCHRTDLAGADLAHTLANAP